MAVVRRFVSVGLDLTWFLGHAKVRAWMAVPQDGKDVDSCAAAGARAAVALANAIVQAESTMTQ